jgi:MerR family transcriptional regulator, thiopeptide resistance regulator
VDLGEAVKTRTREVFRTKEFAELAGVTVRALHHYDRLGIVRPKQRSEAGYRLYSMRDFARLEQLVVLKFLGIPLKQIRKLLESEANLGSALQQQLNVLAEKRLQLDRAIRAIGNARRSLQSRNEPDWKLFQFIVQEIEMQKKMEWKGKYFSPAAKLKVTARRNELSVEYQEKANKEWMQLYADIQATLGEDPAGAKGQALAARWTKLIEDFTGGDPDILEGLKAMMADRANWPAEAQAASQVTPEAEEFLKNAVRAAKHSLVP